MSVKKVIDRRQDEQNYCYSLSHKSSKPFGQEVFKKSTTCEGQFCFISLTTSEIVLESVDFKHDYSEHDEFVGTTRPRYELLAGCLKVDDDNVRTSRPSTAISSTGTDSDPTNNLFFQKITLGCTAEYLKNASDPLSKHCICDSHLCNFHHLVSGVEDSRPRATKKQQEEGERSQNSVPRTMSRPPASKFANGKTFFISLISLALMLV
ncbi:hypothetical protein ANCDUO_01276 [Ancylostoma duodenale]|uniref:Uncharacterized protein n=1 Tax=Ancylostoma duodenale TaxID=51022 RepID=A0A0C2DEM2_9BILA|nr:hypothetical protein ANCDUO_01276 [Ancylostoma duodenale]